MLNLGDLAKTIKASKAALVELVKFSLFSLFKNSSKKGILYSLVNQGLGI